MSTKFVLTRGKLSNLADIVKMIDSQPDLAPLIRRVRGGYLKIQGTWMPYEVSHFFGKGFCQPPSKATSKRIVTDTFFIRLLLNCHEGLLNHFVSNN